MREKRQHTKSKAAIFLLFFGSRILALASLGVGAKHPTRRLFLTIRQVRFLGSFLEAGAKKFATALSTTSINIPKILWRLEGLERDFYWLL